MGLCLSKRRRPPSRWSSDLPPELAGLILRRLLSHADHLSFRAVCRHWRLAEQQQRPLSSALPLIRLEALNPSHQVPGTKGSRDGIEERGTPFLVDFYRAGTLAFPRSRSRNGVPGTRNAASSRVPGDYALNFQSLAGGELRRFTAAHLPHARARRTIRFDSADGWLEYEAANRSRACFLENPFSGATIDVPAAGLGDLRGGTVWSHMVHMIVCSPDLIAAVFTGGRVGFYRPGAPSWSITCDPSDLCATATGTTP
ncbi:unnamed protein product [Urochloa humidicola]